jgi:putative membrane protein
MRKRENMMGIGLLVFLAILAALFFIFRDRLPTGNPPRREEETPEEILKRRYANGEISKEDYERMLEEVKG